MSEETWAQGGRVTQDYRERPILFSGPMVRALLDGRKTQTRRVVKCEPHTILRLSNRDEFCDASPYPLSRDIGNRVHYVMTERGPIGLPCPYGVPGDRLWVRETWAPVEAEHGGRCVAFRADCEGQADTWRPSIHMPRAVSRITLEITDVRVQRLRDITDEDAIAEGIAANPVQPGTWINYPEGSSAAGWKSPRRSYESLWDTINGSGAFISNPWVWCLTFKRIET